MQKTQKANSQKVEQSSTLARNKKKVKGFDCDIIPVLAVVTLIGYHTSTLSNHRETEAPRLSDWLRVLPSAIKWQELN